MCCNSKLLLPFWSDGVFLYFFAVADFFDKAFFLQKLQHRIHRSSARAAALALFQLITYLVPGHILLADKPQHQKCKKPPHIAYRYHSINNFSRLFNLSAVQLYISDNRYIYILISVIRHKPDYKNSAEA